MQPIIKQIERGLGIATTKDFAEFLGMSEHTFKFIKKKPQNNPKMRKYLLMNHMLKELSPLAIKRIKKKLA